MNTRLREINPDSEELFDVVLMTNNHAYVGLRLINTINHYSEFQQHHQEVLFSSPWKIISVCLTLKVKLKVGVP